ncbi:co-chaperone DjlA [Mixta gaviniae]|uniref:Co-chaperone protein DjlA n=1 Tax=Mixta gaviniae TaxID=665914 RepID=A0A1X1DFJ7_9GAMM|nr:co-chaperone DjlA [Mixta gaviniae]AUX92354.1 co-chaperone DjlA [Mixta gaviniae]ORM75374.1 molecular chaperone DjlA [Mixta gaviniae]
MRYWGKVIGLVLGLLSGAGFWGLLIGLLLGHLVDKIRETQGRAYFSNNQTRQTIFFRTTFQVMGHLSKAKGRVTEADIQIASLQMDRMQLHGAARTQAQQAFREGKQSDYPLRNKLRELRSACFGRFDLIRMFLEIQIQAAFADGTLHPNERQVLYVIAEELGISRVQFEQYLRMMEGGQQFGGGHAWGGSSQGGARYGAQQGPTLEAACKVLGVKPTDDYMTIKRAWRKLMAEHHPDKLVAKGLPPEMMEMAKQKAQEIQAAWDLIRKERNFK